ncbi:hypothetical protein [Catenuloplanes japonicus]|uniref:hypothetical protein n=1 Tax=Catenuloplanes japonicus TaxID=33876 RepID=UPI0005242D6D|nr:hypothetical protein [Catenuloplanes japonicus]
MSGFDISTESLRSGGTRVEDLGDQLAGQLEMFAGTLQGYGAPWGTGTIGSLLGPSYLEVSQYVLDCLFIAADELARSGADLVEMGAAYEETEAGAQDSMTAMSTRLG